MNGLSPMYYLRTALQYTVTLLVVLTANFLLPRLAPGNPINALLGSDVVENMTKDQIERIMEEFDLHLPLWQQYVHYLTSFIHGDLGNSIVLGMPVSQVLMQRLPWTLLLMGGALLFSTVVGSLLGAYSAWRRGRAADLATISGVLFVGSLPPFWLAMMLIILFSTTLQWLPSYGAYPIGTPSGSWAWYVGVAKRLVMPTLALGLVMAANVLLIARSATMMALDQDYVTFARAKGLSEQRIFFRHAFRNALLPLVTNVMMSIGSLVGGALVIETVFSYPGLGSLIVMAVNARDYNLLQGIFILVSLSVILANLAADLMYPLVDPRTAEGDPA